MQNIYDYTHIWNYDIGAKAIGCEEDIRLWYKESCIKVTEHEKGLHCKRLKKPIKLCWGPLMILDFEVQYRSYKNGFAIFTGKISEGSAEHKGEYLNCIDIGNKKGLEVLSIFKVDTLEELARITMVECYMENDEKKYHVFIITEIPLKRRLSLEVKSDKDKDEVPAIEVKSDETTFVFVAPSINNNGQPYQIIGTRKPICLIGGESLELEEALNWIYRKYLYTKYTLIKRCKPSHFIYHH